MAFQATGIVYGDEEDKVKRYKSRVDLAERKQKNWLGESEKFLSYYRNKPKVFTKGGQQVRVPVAISAIDAMYSALTAVEVEIRLTPLGTTTSPQAEVAEEALRHEWIKAKVQQEIEYATKDALITGLGWVFVGYEYETAEEEAEREDAELEADALSRIQERFQQTGEYPDPEEIAGEIPTTTKLEYTIKDRVFVEHVCYDEMLWDPEAKKWPDVRWVCRKLLLPWEQVKQDPTFYNTEDLTWDSVVDGNNRSKGDPADDEKRVTLYELHDFETGMVCWFPKEGDQLLREDPIPFAHEADYQDRSQFVPLILRTNPGEVVGIGDVEAMKPSIDEQNVLRSALATYVERAKPKILAKEGAFTAAGKKAARSQEWGEIVEFTAQTSIQDIGDFKIPDMPKEAFELAAAAADDSRNAIGLNELLQGILPVGKKTATGMSILQNASEIRQSERKNRMERLYTDVAQRMLSVMQQFYDTERITKITGETGDTIWNWTGDDIVMLHNLEVTLQPKIPVDDATTRENMLMLKNIFSMDPTIDQAALNRHILKSLHVPADTIKELVKAPEQMQAEAMGAAQQTQVMAEAEQGIPADPADIPGPMSGGETLAVTNEGQLPAGPLERLMGGGPPPPLE